MGCKMGIGYIIGLSLILIVVVVTIAVALQENELYI